MSAGDFFPAEAAECLRELRALLDRGADAADLRAPARRLRGSAQMASRGQAVRAARALESAVRAAQAGEIAWDGRARDTLERALEDMERTVDGEGAVAADAVVGRIASLGVAAGGEPPASGAGAAAGADFLAFARGEIARIRDAIDRAAGAGAGDRPDRASLHALLDAQASLAGSARLTNLPLVARALEAADHITRALLAGTAGAGDWAGAYRDIAGVLGDDRIEADPAPADLASRLEAARAVVTGRDGGEPDIPVEVANFFRAEAASELARAEQLARDAAEDRIATAQDRLRASLDGLATTASTFGFTAIGGRLERAVREVAELEPGRLPRAIAELRAEILGALGVPAAAPASPDAPRRGTPAPIVTAGADEEDVPDAHPGAGPLGTAGAARAEPGAEAGSGAAVAGAPAADAARPAPRPDADGAVPIASLCYAGRDAFDRAASLRAEWEAAEGDAARRIVEEVFDLIDLGRR